MRCRENLLLSSPSTSYSAPPAPARRPCRRHAHSVRPNRAAEQAASHSNGFVTSNGHTAPEQQARVERHDYNKFVQYFRSAGPYIEGFRGCTFVLVVPGEVMPRMLTECACFVRSALPADKDAVQVFIQKHLLHSFLKDATLLHGACT